MSSTQKFQKAKFIPGLRDMASIEEKIGNAILSCFLKVLLKTAYPESVRGGLRERQIHRIGPPMPETQTQVAARLMP